MVDKTRKQEVISIFKSHKSKLATTDNGFRGALKMPLNWPRSEHQLVFALYNFSKEEEGEVRSMDGINH